MWRRLRKYCWNDRKFIVRMLATLKLFTYLCRNLMILNCKLVKMRFYDREKEMVELQRLDNCRPRQPSSPC